MTWAAPPLTGASIRAKPRLASFGHGLRGLGVASASPTPVASASPAGPSFDSLPLSPAILANLAQLGYRGMTPIQAASLPLAPAGHDLIAQAKNGSGKTAAAFMREPKEVKLLGQDVPARIRQRFYEVRDDERLHAVSLLLNRHRPLSTLAFCNTKQQCRDLAQVLRALDAAQLSMDEMGRVGQIEHAGGFASEWHPLAALTPQASGPLQPPMRTLQIVGGRKEKIRPGDVLGALTKDLGFAGAQIGKINVNEFSTYVAVEAGIANEALRRLSSGKVKGRSVKVRLLEG